MQNNIINLSKKKKYIIIYKKPLSDNYSNPKESYYFKYVNGYYDNYHVGYKNQYNHEIILIIRLYHFEKHKPPLLYKVFRKFKLFFERLERRFY